MPRGSLLWAALLLAVPSVGAAQGGPNAEAVSVEAGPTAVAGDALSIIATVRIDPGMNVTLTPYLTAGGVLGGATALAPIAVPQPPVGRTVRIETQVALPTNASGVFTLGVALDANNVVPEANELDNYVFAPTITRIRPQRAEPTVVLVTPVTRRARPDDPASVEVNLQNVGELEATVEVAAYLSRDLEVSPTDPQLATQTITIAAGASLTRTLTGAVPADLAPGAYTLGVVVDPSGAVPEIHEGNNVTPAEGAFVVYLDTLTLDTATLPGATLTLPYHVALQSTGGDGTFRYAVTAGSVPDGLELTPAGVLSGIPNRSGDYAFTVQVSSDGKTAATDYAVSVSRTNAPLTIATREASQGFLNMPYEQVLVAGGGEAPYSWDLVAMGGVLPPGLDLSPAGLLTGVPNTLGTFNFTVEVEDFLGNRDQTALQIQVTSATNVIVLTNDLDPLPVGEPVSVSLAATGGVEPYVWVALSPPPPGLSLSEDGRLVGTPSQVGRWPVWVRVTDGSRGRVNDSAAIYVDVVDAGEFEIDVLELPNATVRRQYEQVLTARGGEPPLKWSLSSGATLPDDFYMVDGDGTDAPVNAAFLYGFALFEGVHGFTVRVEDAFGRQREMTYALTVDPVVIDLGGGCRAVDGDSAAGLAVLVLGLGLLRRRRR